MVEGSFTGNCTRPRAWALFGGGNTMKLADNKAIAAGVESSCRRERLCCDGLVVVVVVVVVVVSSPSSSSFPLEEELETRVSNLLFLSGITDEDDTSLCLDRQQC
jgi:hypothetical protein